MSEDKFKEYMKEQNRNLQKQGVRIMPPVCSECGEKMVNAIDSITKKISKYLWKTTCGHMKNLILSIG